MKKVLVTDAASFLGYHIVKNLIAKGIYVRALVPRNSDPAPLLRLLWQLAPQKKALLEIVGGSVMDSVDKLKSVFAGMDTIMHMEFEVSVGETLGETNVQGTRNLLAAVRNMSVTKIVVNSSVLSVGLSDDASVILDEAADSQRYQFDLPYAVSRGEAEQLALDAAEEGLPVVVVNPSFTIGPEDFAGAPANRILKFVKDSRLRLTFDVGLGCLDVRDFAEGVRLAAEKGRVGQRYILSSHNVMMDDFMEQAEVAARKVTKSSPWKLPRLKLPSCLLRGLIKVVGFRSRRQNKPSPVANSVARLFGRYAWYSSDLARNELGWTPRALNVSFEDSIAWMNDEETKKKVVWVAK